MAFALIKRMADGKVKAFGPRPGIGGPWHNDHNKVWKIKDELKANERGQSINAMVVPYEDAIRFCSAPVCLDMIG